MAEPIALLEVSVLGPLIFFPTYSGWGVVSGLDLSDQLVI